MADLGFFNPNTAEKPYDRFMEFIAPAADRCAILSSILDDLKLNSTVLPVHGCRHFLVLPPGFDLRGGFPFRGRGPAVLTAHYDRAPGSSGANDNSAAVFCLIRAAALLSQRGGRKWMIFFTDREELRAGEGITSQGAYGLAGALIDGGLADARVYVFDACGAGDTLVISTSADYLLKSGEGRHNQKTREQVRALRTEALRIARDLNLDRVMLLPTPLSEDAGFLMAGLPAQMITVLPAEEAGYFSTLIRGRGDFAGALLSRERGASIRGLIPETWRSLNGPADTMLKLTPKQFGRVIRFALALGDS